MIICEYCQTQLPDHSLFCCQCGREVHLSDETLISTTLGPALKSALAQKQKVTAQYAGPGSPHYGNFNKPAATKIAVRSTWEEDEDDTWI